MLLGARRHRLVSGALLLGSMIAAEAALAGPVLTSQVTLANPAINDEDDMCIWIHPADHSLSTIVASDKAANKLFVYDLGGNTLQVISTSGQPGNIDVRYNFMLGGVPIDIVAFNDRSNNKVQVFRVDPGTRLLTRVDNNAIATGSNYGFTLYRSFISGSFYAFTTSDNGTIEQYLLSDQGGQVAGIRVRTWSVGSITEGAAGDDVNGCAFFSQENVGIWKVGAEPGAPTPGSLIAHVNDASGLKADAEGVAVYHAADSDGYLIASSQGSSEYKVFRLKAPHAYVETFTISGVTKTDGIDVTNVNLGPAFPYGIFTAHNGSPSNKPVEVCALEGTGLVLDTYSWDPRTSTVLDVPGRDPASGVVLTSYPNPFVAATRVRYQLATTRRVMLEVLDLAGRTVATLASGEQDAGVHELEWNARDAQGRRLPTGLYLVRAQLGEATVTHKVVVAH